MKIVGVSNHIRDDVYDVLIADCIDNELYAEIMADALNESIGNPDHAYYYLAKPDSYVLYGPVSKKKKA